MKPISFQNKLTFVYLALFLAVQGAVLVVFNLSVPGRVRTEVDQQLAASARVCERIIEGRIDRLGAGAQLLAQDFGFRDAVASGDRPTVLSALRNQQARLHADFAMVVGLEGETLAAVAAGGVVAGTPDLPADLKLQAETAGMAARVLMVDGHLHEVVLVPVAAPVPVAWIAFGMALDAETARSFAALFPIALDIAFLQRNDAGVWQLAASADPDDQIGAALAAGPAEADGVFTDPDHVRRLLPLDGGTPERESAAVLLSYPIAAALAPFRDLVLTLMAVLGVGMIILAAGGVAISRSLTRPLRDLAAATRQVAAGDYREVASPTRDLELSDLTTSFNRMVGAVKDRELQIMHQASHDTDTGLPNHLAFSEMLGQRAGRQVDFVLLLAELQDLPELRSVLNHESLNELVAAVGGRLRRVCGTEVARLSTETFALLIEQDADPDVMASIIHNSFQTPFTVAETTVDASVRLGLAASEGGVADLPALLRRAHAALDRARTTPEGTAWYDPETAASHSNRLSLMSDLREGLRRGEVHFAYQPKFDLAAGRITAVEALIRWHSPTRGYVPPDDFIPLAERTGDIRHVTAWGLAEAIAQVAAWRSRGLHLIVAVNISAGDLMDRELPRRIRDLLRRHSVPATSLQLEVTESAVMQDPDRALEVLGVLASMEIGLAIDDFGTGYSSLGYLKRLPVSELKIDRSFVMNLVGSEEDRILVRSTVELGHNLGLTVTAEGVEDSATVDLLNAYGCDMLQGYHIGRPIPAAELEQMLEQPIHA
jgi:predicted signal transduction protein with EAL and GGDEF domain